MKKFLTLMLVAVSSLAMAEAQKVPTNIDNTAESVAPAFTNPYKDVGHIPVTFPNQPPLLLFLSSRLFSKLFADF